MADLVPFVRAADARASAEWWARLGFEVEWEHRFGGTREVELRDRDGNRVRVGSTAA